MKQPEFFCFGDELRLRLSDIALVHYSDDGRGKPYLVVLRNMPDVHLRLSAEAGRQLMELLS